ncbi:MAG: DUF853 family protein [Erysipelotrichaceae bacterium]|nr:DUF853 family protein [Erysipelotrichaceae bacterium]
MIKNNKLWIAQSDKSIFIEPKMANRHGLIAGASGTGKTVTLKVLAESFSSIGVPVFLADIKGDLSGMCEVGEDNENMQERIKRFGIEDFTYRTFPTRFWDIFGEQGHPIRVTISDMGPLLLSRLLGLTDVQAGVLTVVFRIADDNGLLLIDLKDLRSMLQFVGENRKQFTTEYGNVSTQSIGAIQRALLQLEEEGGNIFFGEPALDIKDWIQTDSTGKGYINILNSTRLVQNPLLYATFLLWMLSELFEKLPEVGDLDKPRIVFFFDEAHLLFSDAPKALLTKIIQIVKLIRSKGVGVYFITQSPSDIPDEVLAQLSNRVQHALRAYTPSEAKAVRIAAQTFRQNPSFSVEEAITELGVGEALVSFLDEEGVPGIVERAFILPPQSKMGLASDSSIQKCIIADTMELKYRERIERESAYEELSELEEQEQAQEVVQEEVKKTTKKSTSTKKSALEKAINSASSSVSRSISRNIVTNFTGGSKVSASKMVERAATNAFSTLLRETTKSISRGIFGTRK